MGISFRRPGINAEWLSVIIVIISFIYSLSIMCFSTESWSGFPLDDAWIHLVYGRSVAQSGILGYNEGIPATGCTSISWAILLGILHLLFNSVAHIVLATKILGAFLYALSTAACFEIIYLMIDSRGAAFIAGIFLGMSPLLAMAAVSGMEVALACALCMWANYFLIRKRFALAGLLLAGAYLTRPEFLVLIPVALVHISLLIYREQATMRDLVKLILPCILAAGLMTGRNLCIDGKLFPATFYEKVVAPNDSVTCDTIRFGLNMIAGFTPLGPVTLLLGIAGLILTRSRSEWVAYMLFSSGLLYCGASLMMIFPVDPKSFYHIRYLLPATQLLGVALAIGIAELMGMLIPSKGQANFHRMRITATVLIVSSICISVVLSSVSDFFRYGRKLAEDTRNINEVQVALGKKIDLCLPPTCQVATVDAGAIRYFGKHKTVDLIGLNTPSEFVDSGVQVYDSIVDIMCILPAWVRIKAPVPLVLVDTAKTMNYGVTMDPTMARQDLVKCLGSRQEVATIFMQIRRRLVRIQMRCEPEGDACWQTNKRETIKFESNGHRSRDSMLRLRLLPGSFTEQLEKIG